MDTDNVYQVGHLESPKPDDKEFTDQADAEVYAIEQSYDDCVWGVWFKESGELLSIVYQLQIFSS